MLEVSRCCHPISASAEHDACALRHAARRSSSSADITSRPAPQALLTVSQSTMSTSGTSGGSTHLPIGQDTSPVVATDSRIGADSRSWTKQARHDRWPHANVTGRTRMSRQIGQLNASSSDVSGRALALARSTATSSGEAGTASAEPDDATRPSSSSSGSRIAYEHRAVVDRDSGPSERGDDDGDRSCGPVSAVKRTSKPPDPNGSPPTHATPDARPDPRPPRAARPSPTSPTLQNDGHARQHTAAVDRRQPLPRECGRLHTRRPSRSAPEQPLEEEVDAEKVHEAHDIPSATAAT